MKAMTEKEKCEEFIMRIYEADMGNNWRMIREALSNLNDRIAKLEENEKADLVETDVVADLVSKFEDGIEYADAMERIASELEERGKCAPYVADFFRTLGERYSELHRYWENKEATG